MGTITLSETNQDVIKNIIEKVANVPMLSQVVMRLLSLIGSSDHSLQEVVKIVESDAALTARILRVSNTAAFFRGNQVNTVPKAILQLGEKMVAGIAIGSCTSNVFKSPLQGYESGEGELWNHSLRTAIASREIASKFAKRVDTDLAFTAGLLHDIGKAILSEFFRGNASEMVQKCDKSNTDFLQAEMEHAGTTHSAVGGVLANHWNLPIAITEAIQHHHSPSAAADEFRALVYAVHLGDLIAMMGGTGTGADALAYKIDPGYEEYFIVDKDAIPELMFIVQDEFSRTKSAVFLDEGV